MKRDKDKPKFDFRRSFNKLLEVLCEKQVDCPVSDARIPFLSKDERMDIINAGITRSYKRRIEYKEKTDDGSTESLLAAIKKCGTKGMAIDPLNHKTSSRISDLKLKGKIYEPKRGVYMPVADD